MTLKRVDSLVFPNVHLALKLFGTLSITACECERSFLSLRIVNTWDCSTTVNTRINGLAIVFTNREAVIHVSEIIDLFAQKSRWTQWKWL